LINSLLLADIKKGGVIVPLRDSLLYVTSKSSGSFVLAVSALEVEIRNVESSKIGAIFESFMFSLNE